MIRAPKLYSTIVMEYPLLDMMLFHKLSGRERWINEYGNPGIPQQSKYLKRFSPYHTLGKEISYPEPLFLASTEHDRVHPGHARKMAAKMEQYGYKFLFYEDAKGGHSNHKDLKLASRCLALIFTYFHKKLV